jgi:hypothetical protein
LHCSLDGLRDAQRVDEDIGCIIRLLTESYEKPPWDDVATESRTTKTLWHQWPRLDMRDGLLKRRFESVDGLTVCWQTVWPKAMRMQQLYSGMTGGHLDRRQTAAASQSRVYWPFWSSDLSVFLRSCAVCAQYKRGKAPRQTRLQTPPVGEPWERVSVDITGPHPRSSKGNQYMITLVDHFSKWAEAIAVPNHTAITVARVLVMQIFSRFGAPKQLLTDRGREFDGQLFSELMRWMGVNKLRTTAYSRLPMA